jgi:signal peptidase II
MQVLFYDLIVNNYNKEDNMEFLYIFLLIAGDQIAKYAARARLTDRVVTLIPGCFELTYLENRGAAFGIFQSKRFILIGLTSIVILALIIYMLKRKPAKPWIRVSLILIIGGAIGNLIDRVANGYVVDYLHFYVRNVFDFPVFNFADICVVTGTILLAAELLFTKEQS